MSQRFKIPPYSSLGKRLDEYTHPVMRLVAKHGESPMLTHWWNNLDVPVEIARDLDVNLMVSVPRDPYAPRRRGLWDLRFHLGWWQNYVVFEPTEYVGLWHLGWSSGAGTGVSHLSFDGSVRALRGPDDVAFLGIAAATQVQIPIRVIGHGRLGDMGPFRKVPLI